MLRHFVCLLAFVAVAMPARGQALADRVPADAIIYIGWQGADELGDG